jgi:hypothetical protein
MSRNFIILILVSLTKNIAHSHKNLPKYMSRLQTKSYLLLIYCWNFSKATTSWPWFLALELTKPASSDAKKAFDELLNWSGSFKNDYVTNIKM